MELLLFIFPLLSFLIVQFFGNIKNKRILYVFHNILIISSFVISVYLFLKLIELDNDLPVYFYPIIKSEAFLVDWSLRIDLFVSGLILIINFVGSIFAAFIVNFYKEHKISLDTIKVSSLLIFGSLTLVSSNDLIQFFVGWQIIILSSYLVTNLSKRQNNFHDIDNVFLFNRLSDLGVFLSLFFLYSNTNSFNFDVIFESHYLVKKHKLTFIDTEFSNFELIVFGLFLSFLLRCRQFFRESSRYYFLKINASTLALLYSGIYLPSGIYFLLRFLPLIQTYYNFFNILILLGLILTIIFTLLFFTSKDLKSLTLYVASSQFGILIFLTGLKVYNGVVFYLLTSTLSVTMFFLSFAIIIMKLNGEHQTNKMGSLFIKTPSIFLFTLIGFLSLIGIPFFSGFYSKKLIFSSILTFNETFILLIIIISFCYIYLLSYTLFKNILIVFFCQNNCNIHLYNKINEKMFLTKIILLVLTICLIFSGMLLNNLFSGSGPKYLWNLTLTINSDFAIKHENKISVWFIELTHIMCISAILFSIFNYIAIPKIGKNLKIKHSNLFKKYSTFLSSNR